MIIKLMNGIRQFQGEKFKKLESVFIQLSQGQNPETLFFTCSDSRIDPNIITKSKPGDLFIARNVGNIVPPYGVASSEAAAIEYALDVLKVKDIVICGHSKCGAMQGLLTHDLENTLPAVANWLTHAHPVLDQVEEKFGNTNIDLDLKLKATTEYNILTQIEHLKTYPAVIKKLNQQEITIHGWYYELKSGEVFIYKPKQKQFIPLKDSLNEAVNEKINMLTENIAMQYLKLQAHPKKSADYLKLMHLFNQLKLDIKPIWTAIKPKLIKEIWRELGFMFTNKHDIEFLELINNTANHKLETLDTLRKEVSESAGYHDYCRQQLRAPKFFTKTLARPALSVNNSLTSDTALSTYYGFN